MAISTMAKKIGREDLLIGTFIASFFVIVATIAMFTPAADFILKPAKTQVEDNATKNGTQDRGIFRLGSLLFTLGDSDEYIDSDIDLEYNKSAVKKLSGEKKNSEANPDTYFEGKKARIKDALLTNASGFTSKKVSGKNGFDRFKDHMVDAINNQISRTDDVVTNIYFRRFILVPTDK